MGARRTWGCLTTLIAIATFLTCYFGPFVWIFRLFHLPSQPGFPLNAVLSFALIFLFYGSIPIAGLVRRWLKKLPDRVALLVRGRTADGQITNPDTGGDGDSRDRHARVFIMRADDRVGNVEVELAADDRLVRGAPVRVRYHPTRPLAALVRPLTLRRLVTIAPAAALFVAVVLGWAGVIWWIVG